MVVRRRKEKVEQIDEKVQQSTVLETDKYKYLGMVVNTEGNLKDHMQELGQKKKKNQKMQQEQKNQVGTEEIAVKLKLFEL